MTARIFIDGGAGTTGLEIHQRLAGRPELELLTLDEQQRKQDAARRDALNAADVVILCLPDDAARDAVAMIDGDHVRVIDASTAHRVAPGWAYGFPELDPGHAEAVAAATRVANPGCYPTGFLALVRPLIRAGLVPAGTLLSVNATSGYSGGGKSMIAEFEGASGAPTAFRNYALTGTHKHVPEMQKHARLEHPPIFMPSVANVYRGMIVEVPLHLHALPRKPTTAMLEAALRDAYRDTPLIDVAEGDDLKTIMIEENAGTDRMTLRVCGDGANGQARLIATLDNLGKGAAGAAVQSMNLMLGLDPLAGLNR